MNAGLKDWLLDCPALTGVSALAIDAGELGLIDLRSAVAVAVTSHVRLSALGLLPDRMDRLRRARKGRPGGRDRLEIRIVAGAALLEGELGGSANLAAAPGRATLLLARKVPDTIVCALPGRALASLVQTPLLDAGAYTVEEARRVEGGTAVTFAVPTTPILRIRPSLRLVSRVPGER